MNSTRIIGSAIVALILIFIPALSASAQVVRVDHESTAGGSADGSTWALAYPYLQDAIGAATGGDEIWIADGTYRPDESQSNQSGTGLRTATFLLPDDVTLYGGFLGLDHPSGGENDLPERNVFNKPHDPLRRP